MSSTTTGATRELGESQAQVLQALVNSLSSEPGNKGDGNAVAREQVDKISEKLNELLGDAATGEPGLLNEKGKIVNEEGLPIIEINEEYGNESPATGSVTATSGDFITPWSALSPVEREIRRRERDRILELLEIEEQEDEERNLAKEREERRLALERQKVEAARNAEHFKVQRETQRKMGKALLQNIFSTREREEKELEEVKAREVGQRKLRPRKSVTFADSPQDDGSPANNELIDPSVNMDWGDLSVGRLKPTVTASVKHPTDNRPTKFNVVERFPIRTQVSEERQVDSDDESEAGSLTAADSDDGLAIHSAHDESEDEVIHHSADEESEPEGVDTEVHEDEFDFDAAQHQREIALAYYDKRGTIGQEALQAMSTHTHDEDRHEWDQPEVPLDATLSADPPKGGLSRFKANRLSNTSTRNPNSLPQLSNPMNTTSLGPTILPASVVPTVRGAIRVGKLEGGQLVGGPSGDSDSEDEDEMARRVFEMLQRGDLTNVGPTPLIGTSHEEPKDTTERLKSSTTPTTPAMTTETTTVSTALPPSKPTSRFKAAQPRSADQTRSSSREASSTTTKTPITNRLLPKPVGDLIVERSSLKSSNQAKENISGSLSSQAASISSPTRPMAGTPIVTPTSFSRRPPRMGSQSDPITPVPTNAIIPSMIVESPSFPQSHPGASSLMVNLPSFPKPSSITTGPSSTSLLVTSDSKLSTSRGSSQLPAASPLLGRPAVAERVVESRVREDIERRVVLGSDDGNSVPVRVSKFKANRA